VVAAVRPPERATRRPAGRRWWRLLSVLTALAAAGCASTSRPGAIHHTGHASWYGGAHHGRTTASGERFDMYALTAAHPSLPFGTRLRVVNLANDRVVVVRVNDRGPTVRGRILDLSYAAARALDAVRAGVIPVRITVLD
jgi:rare lipoprotein A